MIYTEPIQGVETGESKRQLTIIAAALRLLASLAACQGDDAVERILYEESLTIASEVDYKWYLASCLEVLANELADQGQPACAAKLGNTAEFLRDSAEIPDPPAKQVACDHTGITLHAHFGKRDFIVARSEERTLLPEQAMTKQDTGGESPFLKQPDRDEQSEHAVSEQAVLQSTTYPFALD